jgi:RNA polymerase sigma-70 factor (ECF subfamily)
MTKLREMSLKEASRESGMSVAALKVATYRGIKALQAVLKARSKAI